MKLRKLKTTTGLPDSFEGIKTLIRDTYSEKTKTGRKFRKFRSGTIKLLNVPKPYLNRVKEFFNTKYNKFAYKRISTHKGENIGMNLAKKY